ncbi:MAG: DegT/DnrJ/EryC1/StrS aminotransferase family protein [Thermoplasmata archaeon]
MINIAKPLLGEEEKRAVLEVMGSGKLAQGERVEQFEKAFASYIGTKHAVAVGNGTIAIHLALLAHGIGNGAEVVTTPFTFIGTVTPITFCGARPVFADIDPRTFNILPNDISKALTDRTKAILPVHLFGLPADMDEILELAERRGIPVIEDACQAHGALYKGKRVGSLGSCACFSFYPTKNMTTGEGGMVTTNDDELASKIRLLRDHGQKSRYEHVVIGYNFRMNDISAAIGIEQLKKLEGFNAKRRANASVLDRGLQGIQGVVTPHVPEGLTHVYHQYTIRARLRDALKDYLEKNGIKSGVYYPRPVTDNPPLRPFATRPTPNAKRACREVLSLPVHPALAEEDLARIVNTIASFYIGK